MGNVVSAVGFKRVRKSQEFVFGIESVHIDVGCELGPSDDVRRALG